MVTLQSSEQLYMYRIYNMYTVPTDRKVANDKMGDYKSATKIARQGLIEDCDGIKTTRKTSLNVYIKE